MKVLHITSRADTGGGPEHLFQQLKYQQQQKIECFVACPNDEPYKKKYTSIVGEKNICEIPHRQFSLKKLIKLRTFVLKNDVSLLHSHGKGAGLYSRLLGLITKTNVIHTFHGIHIKNYNYLKKQLYFLYERIFSLFSNKIIMVSQSEFIDAKKLKFFPEYKGIVIDNGVEVPNYRTRKFEENKLSILNINRFNMQKNPELLYEIASKAFKEFPSISIIFNVIGASKDLESYQNESKKKIYGNCLNILGPTEDPRKYMQDADIFLSTSRWEGMPLANLEAMSEGLPILASYVTGNKDIMTNNKEGLFFHDNDAADALKKMKIMFNQNKRHEFSKNAYLKVKKEFSVSSMVDKTINLYKNL